MTIIDILECLKRTAHLTQREIALYLDIRESLIRRWKNGISVPTKHQVNTILHFASIYGIDVSQFSWQGWIESVLLIVYEDEYRIDKGVDIDRHIVHLSRVTDGADAYVPIETITGRRKDLFGK